MKQYRKPEVQVIVLKEQDMITIYDTIEQVEDAGSYNVDGNVTQIDAATIDEWFQ